MSRERILLVDDEPDIIKTTGLALESEGYEIITAVDGKEAVELVRDKDPDLLVLDVLLPKINGDEVARILKTDEKYKRIPIIFITALTQKSDEEYFNKLNVDFYMRKPFDLAQLSNKIKELLQVSSD